MLGGYGAFAGGEVSKLFVRLDSPHTELRCVSAAGPALSTLLLVALLSPPLADSRDRTANTHRTRVSVRRSDTLSCC